MKQGLLALLLLVGIGIPTYGQTNIGQANELVNLLTQKVNQIVNKAIIYNYYLGDDLYTEKSFISDAKLTILQNKVKIYYYITTQKYDLHTSAMIRSEYGASVVFDPSSIETVNLKGKYTDYAKSELGLLVINFNKEVEKHTYIQKKKNEDPSLLDNPLVYEFELPFLKSDISNPAAIQKALLDLKNTTSAYIK